MEVEEVTCNVKRLTTMVTVGGIDEGNSEEPGATCMFGLDGIQRVSIIHLIRNDMGGGGGVGEGNPYTAASPQQACKF